MVRMPNNAILYGGSSKYTPSDPDHLTGNHVDHTATQMTQTEIETLMKRNSF